MIDGRLWEVVAYERWSHMQVHLLLPHVLSQGGTVFFTLVSMVNWIVQTYKCTIMHTRLNKKRPPFLFPNGEKGNRMFQIKFSHPMDKCLSAVTFEAKVVIFLIIWS